MIGLLREAEKAAAVQASVFILGDAGTGRRTLARFIHEKSMNRGGRFVIWNPEEVPRLQEGDTVLLENIHEASVSSLMKVRQLIEDFSNSGFHRIRWFVTSCFSAEKWMESSSVARDLGYRLCVMTLKVPRLQERREDIPGLSNLFLQVCCLVNGMSERKLSIQALRLLENYDWIGHVAELNNAIDRAALRSEKMELIGSDFSFLTVPATNSETLQLAQAGMSLSEMEKKLIFQTLELTRQNKTRAARLLGISIRTLRNKLNTYQRGGSDVEQYVR